MTGGDALGSRALADAGPRDVASEWGGPDRATSRDPVAVARQTARRATVRKP